MITNREAEEILKKRRELEEHIRLAQEIPIEIDKYITKAYK